MSFPGGFLEQVLRAPYDRSVRSAGGDGAERRGGIDFERTDGKDGKEQMEDGTFIDIPPL